MPDMTYSIESQAEIRRTHPREPVEYSPYIQKAVSTGPVKKVELDDTEVLEKLIGIKTDLEKKLKSIDDLIKIVESGPEFEKIIRMYESCKKSSEDNYGIAFK